MPYFVTFLEGLVTFLSPCLLPMLPIYLSYFAGGSPEQSPRRVLKNALAFVLGFTVLFVLMGGFAGTIGALFSRHQTAVNVVCGLVVICFGLHFLGLFDLPFFRGSRGFHRTQDMGFFSALLFGCVFAVGWTPCIGAFLGSALMLASQQGSALEGILLLLCYSIGLGVLSSQRSFTSIPAGCLSVDHGPLWPYQPGLRRPADPDRPSDGHRHDEPPAHLSELNSHLLWRDHP